MEIFIRQNFGNDVFFMTSMATVVQFNSEDISALELFIERENINEIIIVNDTACRFINAALKNEKQFGSHAEKIIKKIVLENNVALYKITSEEEKRKLIAKAIINNQLHEMVKHNTIFSKISINKITVKGIITTKSINEIIELNFHNN